MSVISIRDIQGDKLLSPYATQTVTVTGVVTAVVRRGFFLQTPEKEWDGKGSDGVFVYSPDWIAAQWSEVEVTGECVDYVREENAKPVTQVHMESSRVKSERGREVQRVEFTQEFLPHSRTELATLLNSLEGMLITIAPGQTFLAPSNRYGDYVLALDAENTDNSGVRTIDRGIIVEAVDPLRWFPGFRITNYNHAPRLNVGSKLITQITAPLNYRVGSYQLALTEPFKHEDHFVSLTKSGLSPSDNALTIMTLNCFNLDPHVESEALVMNPSQDIDDDWGEGRFHTLGQAVALQANLPDIVALQEIQDNDGAEMTDIVDASKTYGLLIETIEELSGIRYDWIDVEPEVGADGGQPGGNIRNGFLYNPSRVELNKDSVRVIGKEMECFEGSRKPLVCEFIEKVSGNTLAIINVHLASKRHQASIFSPEDPGVDAKLMVRIEQAVAVREEARKIYGNGTEYYITGDFNDTENSETMEDLVGLNSVNLVDMLLPEERYDYNHRGKLQVLMHGIVSETMASKAQYEIIHGNELIGVKPGEESDKPSDHAYVIAKLSML